MAAPTQINHRRNRRQTRRILSDVRIRCRDLTGSILPLEIDLLDAQPPVSVVRHPSVYQRYQR
jgi:hypothetical protein